MSFYLKEFPTLDSSAALRDAMEARNEPEEFIRQVLEVYEHQPSASSVPLEPSRVEVSPQAAEYKSPLIDRKEDKLREVMTCSVLKKYARMCLIGIPSESILVRMKLDSVGPQQRNRFLKALGEKEEDVNQSPIKKFTKRKGKTTPPSRGSETRETRLQSDEKQKKSVWGTPPNAVRSRDSLLLALGEEIEEQELQEVQEFFAQQNGEAVHTRRYLQSLRNNETASLRVLEVRRAQNIAIGLVQFKSFGSTADFLRAILSLDNYGGKVTADVLDNFSTLLPTTAEFNRILEMASSKHPVELFFQDVLPYYPELPHRLRLFRLCLTFENDCTALLLKSKNIIDTCNQVTCPCRIGHITLHYDCDRS